MVRLLMTPKSIEQQFLKKNQWLDTDQMRVVHEVFKLPPCRRNTIVIFALCTDGESNVDAKAIQSGLMALYSILDIRVSGIEVVHFSFKSENIQLQLDTLAAADVFWFAGVHGVSAKLKYALSHSGDDDDIFDVAHPQVLAVALRKRVQYDHLTYVGVCGGGSLAGSSHNWHQCGLDLLNGVSIVQTYTSELSKEAEHTEAPRVQFSSSCACVLLLQHDYASAICFPVIKNASSRQEFAATNTLVLQSIVERIANEWKEFMSPNGKSWSFNLRGYYRFGNQSEVYTV